MFGSCSRSVVVVPSVRDRVLGRPGNVLLSHALRRSTIGAEGLHGRVRNGIGCFPLAITTRPSKRTLPGARVHQEDAACLTGMAVRIVDPDDFVSSILQHVQRRGAFRCVWTISLPIDRSEVNKPIELLVPVSFMRYRTSTPGLSTWSSTTTLREYSFPGRFPA